MVSHVTVSGDWEGREKVSHVTASGDGRDTGNGVTCNGFWVLGWGKGRGVTCNGFRGLG
jgi:hypothetical protein